MERPVAYISRSLSDVESRYQTQEYECLAVVHAVSTWHRYIVGGTLTIKTDHHNLQLLLDDPRKFGGRLARWATVIGQYNPKIEYKAGKSIPHADCLSRAPRTDVEPDWTAMDDHPSLDLRVRMVNEPHRQRVVVAAQHPDPTWRVVLRRAQRADAHLAEIITAINNTAPSRLLELRPDLKNYRIDQETDLLQHKVDDLLDPQRKLWPAVVPEVLRERVLEKTHSQLGHQRQHKVRGYLRPRYFWKNMRLDVLQYLEQCTFCQLWLQQPQLFGPLATVLLRFTLVLHRRRLRCLG